MTNQEILTKAIEKAIAGGWKYPFGANCYEINKYVKARPEVIAFGFREDWQDKKLPGHLEGHWSIPELIFNHDFDKALWPKGKHLTLNHQREEVTIPDWQYHLQNMVLAEDPIKYLGENI